MTRDPSPDRRRVAAPLRARLAPLTLLGALAGCGGEATQPTPPVSPMHRAGLVELRLQTPATDDGALLLTVTGGAVLGAQGAPGLHAFVAAIDRTTTRLVITGPIAAGTVVSLQVPDVALATTYRATVDQAAVRGTYAQRAPAGYVVRVVAP